MHSRTRDEATNSKLDARTLITGAAAFLGFHLASKIASHSNHQVVLLDNLEHGRPWPQSGWKRSAAWSKDRRAPD